MAWVSLRCSGGPINILLLAGGVRSVLLIGEVFDCESGLGEDKVVDYDNGGFAEEVYLYEGRWRD